MSQENVEIVRQFYDDVNRKDWEAAGSHIGAEAEWDTSGRGSDGQVVRGREAVFKVARERLAAWEDVHFELLETRSAGDRVAAHIGQHARGRLSGVEGDMDWFVSITVRDREIAKYREYWTWSEALEALGLSE